MKETPAVSRMPNTTGPSVALYGHRLGRGGGTGISVYVRELITALATAEDDSTMRFRMCGSPEPQDDPPPRVDLPVYRPPVPRVLLHSLWTTVNRPRVDRFIGRPDLVHVLYPSCPVPARAPSVYTVHDLMPLKSPEWFPAKERRMFRKAVANAAKTAVSLIADSHSVAEEVRDHLGVEPSRVHVVPLGISGAFAARQSPETVDATCSRYGVSPGDYVISVGAVSARKNLKPVVRAVASVSDSRLVLAGPMGLGGEDVVEEIRRLRVGDRVRMTGWLAREELVALVSGATAIAHPSLDEGFGITPLEAMAAGIPAVVSDRGALPETVGDAAIVVDADDVDRWVEAMGRLRDDTVFRSELINRGLARAGEFTWARTAQMTVEVYRRCLGVTA